jgi:hypothetical protein
MFDSFDEVASRRDIDDTLTNLREITRVCVPGVKMVPISRTHDFRSDGEAEQIMHRRAVFSDNLIGDEIRGRSEIFFEEC